MLIKLDKINSVCIYHTAFLGDIALSLFACQLLKNAKPEIKITYVTTPIASGIVKSATAIDEVIIYDKRGNSEFAMSIRKLARKLSKKKFDCIIVPHQSFRTSRIINKTKKKYSISYKSSALRNTYSHLVDHQIHQHEIYRLFELLNAIDYFHSQPKPLVIPAVTMGFESIDREIVDGLLLVNKIQDFICISPGSVWETKRWPSEYFIKMIDTYKTLTNKAIIINGSKSEAQLCSEIADKCGFPSFAGKLTVEQTLYLISRSSGVISNDSAPVHFAQVLNKPVLAIFGPTVPEIGFAPIVGDYIVCEDKQMKCRPCNIHGGHECPIGTHQCMLNVTPGVIMENALKLF
ncbi:MAG: glycosyltransferase family 9 protein [bacterium]